MPPLPGGRDHGGTSGRRSYHGVSWGSAVLDHLTDGGRTTFNAAVLTGGSTAVPVPLNPQPVRIGYRTEFVRSLIPAEDAPNGQFAYMQQTVRTNNAAVTAPGALKPTSVHSLVRINDHTRMVATLSEPVNRVDISDAPLLTSFLDAELNLDLDLATDDGIINGLGTGDLMTGVLVQSGVQTQAFATDKITSIRKGLTKLRVSELVPDGIVLNPADWEAIELAAMAQFAAKDAIGSPIDALTQRLFGIPVVQCNAVPATKAIVGAWGSSSVLHTTGDVAIDWSQETYDPNALGAGVGASDFQRNMLRFRAEQRVQVSWTRPAGFVVVTLA
jgi:HK97 family phage major capsid protein